MPVRWVFMDVGDVLFDENAQHQYYAHSLLLAMRRHGVEVTWDNYLTGIRECVRQSPTTAFVDAARHYVSDNALWETIFHEGHTEYEAMRAPRPYGMLLDNMQEVVRDLSRDFRLGVIANQHPPIVEAIRDYGLQPYFEVVVIDQIVGISKPDPAIFRMALEQAGCAPNEAIMVGDRPDHDIAPARSLGMGTVRFRRGELYVHYEPLHAEERAHRVVEETIRLASVVRNLSAGWE